MTSSRLPAYLARGVGLCLFPARQEITLMGVMLDCPDAGELSAFYAELLGKPVTYQGEGQSRARRRGSG